MAVAAPRRLPRIAEADALGEPGSAFLEHAQNRRVTR